MQHSSLCRTNRKQLVTGKCVRQCIRAFLKVPHWNGRGEMLQSGLFSWKHFNWYFILFKCARTRAQLQVQYRVMLDCRKITVLVTRECSSVGNSVLCLCFVFLSHIMFYKINWLNDDHVETSVTTDLLWQLWKILSFQSHNRRRSDSRKSSNTNKQKRVIS